MNSLCSNSISHFVAQIANRNQRLNTDSKDLHSYKCLFVRNVFEDLSEKTCSTKCGRKKQCVAIIENIPHEEVFRGCTIFGIFFDSWIAKQYKQIDMRSCLSVASSSNDYENRTFGLRAQDVFAPFFCFFSFR